MNVGFGFWFGIIVTVLTVIIFWVVIASQKNIKEKQEKLTAREVALTCTTDMATQYHIHPEIKITINGEPVVIPTDVGITPACMYSIHTHSSDGIIHVEAPIPKEFTISDFFAVWKKDFSRTKILDAVVDDSTEIVVTVNGEKVDTYENTVLKDADKIVISYQKKSQ